jgi:pectinesterase inhibitor-like protein
MTIKQSMSFLLLLVVVVISAGAGLAAGGPSSVIASTCSAVAKDTGAKAVYDDCVGMLSAYPEAASAVDLRGVAIAAADLTAANVTNMEAFIQQLIANLQSCLVAYKEMSETVAGGIQDLRAGRIDAGVNKLRYAENMPEQCFLPYVYAKNQSPIDKEITATMELASTATTIATLLKGAHRV